MAAPIEKSRKDYSEEIERVKEELHRKKWISTPELADEAYTGEYRQKYWRYQLVPGIMQYLEEEKQEVEKKRQFEGGHPTFYWRLRE